MDSKRDTLLRELQKELLEAKYEANVARINEARLKKRWRRQLEKDLRFLGPPPPSPWTRLTTWFVLLLRSFRVWRFSRLSKEQQQALEDAWLARTFPKIRGTPPRRERRLDPGPELREAVLSHELVRYIQEDQPKVH